MTASARLRRDPSRKRKRSLAAERVFQVSCVPPLADGKAPLRLYIRMCFHEYYEAVVAELARGQYYVTVCGTPGIGTSYFYVYLLHRFRAEHPSTTIVTASYTACSVMKKCVVFRPGCFEGVEHRSVPDEEGDVVYLYDGAPTAPTPHRVRMVCFVSALGGWIYGLRKTGFHSAIYMPLWSQDELLEAATDLGLPLAPHVIRDRFHWFGGVPKTVLQGNRQMVKGIRQSIVRCLSRVTSTEQLMQFLRSIPDSPTRASLCVFHLHPEPECGANAFFAYRLGFPSRAIADALAWGITDTKNARQLRICLNSEATPDVVLWLDAIMSSRSGR